MDVRPTASLPDRFSESLLALHGVGPERAGQLARLQLVTVADLLWHRPRRYEDRRHLCSIAALSPQQTATVRGTIVALGVKRFAKGRKSVFEFILDDGTARLHCRWWNLPYMQNYFASGDEVLVFGKLKDLKPRSMDHPETEVIEPGAEISIHLNRVVPVYPLTEGLPQRWLRSLIWRTLEERAPILPETWPTALTPDFLSRQQAIRTLHFPAELPDAEQARARFALEELVQLQRAIQARRKTLLARAQARPCPGTNTLIKPFLAQLGFQLTPAQIQVLRELRGDMKAGAPMRRLLQGDVGAGKTVVAACCALLAVESGFSTILMAPTEILAQQHFKTFSRWCAPLQIPVHLYTGQRKTLETGAPTPDLLTTHDLANPGVPPARPAIVIGTHALIEESFQIDQLGLVIIDEQHRFGVVQRESLLRKGHYPHLLVMTATPIPRTLGLTLYGDLDVSMIETLPAGRSPIKTYVRTPASLPKVWQFLRTKLKEGRQGFIILPRVDESTPGVKAVTREHASLQEVLAPFQVGLLHGRLRAEEKDAIMTAFQANQIQVLLSTSLVEVGIDIPNATVMVIENAEQFGLAQLHQLRGRIGRGTHESFCIVVADGQAPEALERLNLFAETSDGFRIAEADLQLRGPGDLLGEQQSGLPPLAFADLRHDLALVERARDLAQQIG